MKVENAFRQIFESKLMATINIKDEVNDLLINPHINGCFQQILDEFDLTPENNVKQKTLYMILELYFTVRTNSITKDVKNKEKSLRKGMKKNTST